MIELRDLKQDKESIHSFAQQISRVYHVLNTQETTVKNKQTKKPTVPLLVELVTPGRS